MSSRRAAAAVARIAVARELELNHGSQSSSDSEDGEFCPTTEKPAAAAAAASDGRTEESSSISTQHIASAAAADAAWAAMRAESKPQKREVSPVDSSSSSVSSVEALWAQMRQPTKSGDAGTTNSCVRSHSSISNSNSSSSNLDTGVSVVQLLRARLHQDPRATLTVERKQPLAESARTEGSGANAIETAVVPSPFVQRKRPASLVERMAEAKRTKQKKSTVAASAEQWQEYKTANELDLDGVTKGGYLEKQALLGRLDQRQFEAEREARARNRAQEAYNQRRKAENRG